VIVDLSTNKECMLVLTQMNLLKRQQYKKKQETFKYYGGLDAAAFEDKGPIDALISRDGG